MMSFAHRRSHNAAYWLWAELSQLLNFCNTSATLPIGIVFFLLCEAAALKQFRCSSGSHETLSIYAQNTAAATFLKAVASPRQSVFDRSCRCDHDWSKAFCSRTKAYKNMPSAEAPTVCVCRQVAGEGDAFCRQFMTRCFARSSPKSLHSTSRSRTCTCCFNQPDEYCRQVDCRRMHPDFKDANTSCICYDQATGYPQHVCHNRQVTLPTRRRLTDSLLPPSPSPVPVPSANVFRKWLDSGIVLILLILLVVGVSGSLCFVCGMLIFSRLQAKRAERRKGERRQLENELKLLNSHKEENNEYMAEMS